MKNYITATRNSDLVPIKTLEESDHMKIYYLIYSNQLTKYKTEDGICFSVTEYQNYINGAGLPNDLVYLPRNDNTKYNEINYYFMQNLITKYKIGGKTYYSQKELDRAKNRPADFSTAKAFSIDLSTNARINCLYKRLIDMNTKNKEYCQCDNRLQRYRDENGNTCIFLKDYIKPQLKQLAKKLEVKEVEIFNGIYDVIWELYKKKQERKGKEEKQ